MTQNCEFQNVQKVKKILNNSNKMIEQGLIGRIVKRDTIKSFDSKPIKCEKIFQINFIERSRLWLNVSLFRFEPWRLFSINRHEILNMFWKCICFLIVHNVKDSWKFLKFLSVILSCLAFAFYSFKIASLNCRRRKAESEVPITN